VRDREETEELGMITGAINIPLPELRDRLSEVPKNRSVVVYCQKGHRGYLATCLLKGHGFDKVANLRGGYLQAQLNGIPVTTPQV
jgi:rhodanese-related sulfurtransferase